MIASLRSHTQDRKDTSKSAHAAEQRSGNSLKTPPTSVLYRKALRVITADERYRHAATKRQAFMKAYREVAQA
ncbi:Hypothetical protein NTJ_01201 [Nesidiocoris tenuis]|uniref:Uncharacterized protein n=1 Tax=Nesidiocoris tenuis TaxID=355587 RepID=A0ABN7AC41_9HEMI|nr:Hypothetical protein NTJ_01201 [Nesidiocoris tenuis]